MKTKQLRRDPNRHHFPEGNRRGVSHGEREEAGRREKSSRSHGKYKEGSGLPWDPQADHSLPSNTINYQVESITMKKLVEMMQFQLTYFKS